MRAPAGEVRQVKRQATAVLMQCMCVAAVGGMAAHVRMHADGVVPGGCVECFVGRGTETALQSLQGMRPCWLCMVC